MEGTSASQIRANSVEKEFPTIRTDPKRLSFRGASKERADAIKPKEVIKNDVEKPKGIFGTKTLLNFDLNQAKIEPASPDSSTLSTLSGSSGLFGTKHALCQDDSLESLEPAPSTSDRYSLGSYDKPKDRDYDCDKENDNSLQGIKSGIIEMPKASLEERQNNNNIKASLALKSLRDFGFGSDKDDSVKTPIAFGKGSSLDKLRSDQVSSEESLNASPSYGRGSIYDKLKNSNTNDSVEDTVDYVDSSTLGRNSKLSTHRPPGSNNSSGFTRSPSFGKGADLTKIPRSPSFGRKTDYDLDKLRSDHVSSDESLDSIPTYGRGSTYDKLKNGLSRRNSRANDSVDDTVDFVDSTSLGTNRKLSANRPSGSSSNGISSSGLTRSPSFGKGADLTKIPRSPIVGRKTDYDLPTSPSQGKTEPGLQRAGSIGKAGLGLNRSPSVGKSGLKASPSFGKTDRDLPKSPSQGKTEQSLKRSPSFGKAGQGLRRAVSFGKAGLKKVTGFSKADLENADSMESLDSNPSNLTRTNSLPRKQNPNPVRGI